jgi:GT2 family glycosyltransferase
MKHAQRTTESPRISILIPFLPGSQWIARCTAAVRRTVQAIDCEVIVLGNGCAESDMAPVVNEPGVSLLRSDVNLGFAGGCNWMRRHARGELLVLLNDDALPREGWLAHLSGALQKDAAAGAAGAVLVDANNRVQEAGRVLWRDGVSSAVGEGQRISALRLRETFEVDQSSACGLMVRAPAWDSAGGLDDRFHPAYYEDADLAMRLRQRGWKVVCAREAIVEHEGSSSTDALWRRFLGLHNHRLFVERWRDALAQFDERPRDRPTQREVRRTLLGASTRRGALYDAYRVEHESGAKQGGRPEHDTGAEHDTGEHALLVAELAHARAELALKEEYLAFLTRELPGLERALEQLTRRERERARRRELVRRVPFARQTARWLRKRRPGSTPR